jgi:hypothetical protein
MTMKMGWWGLPEPRLQGDIPLLYGKHMAHIANLRSDQFPDAGRTLCGGGHMPETADGIKNRTSKGWWRIVPPALRQAYFDRRYWAPVCQHCLRLHTTGKVMAR